MNDLSRLWFPKILAAIFIASTMVRSFGLTSTPPERGSHLQALQFKTLPIKSRLSAKEDPYREATGIRPSLHPTTINAISDALKARAKKIDGMVFRATESTKPLDVALTAGKIATSAIGKRQETSEEDGMELTPQEEQAIAGRVLGVVMRLDELESMLYERVSNVGWIQKYNEWSTFGVLNEEDNLKEVENRIKDDPLFAVTRAECLLAIFLETVEVPKLEQVGETVPDDSKIDFLDSDRMEVLLKAS